MKNRLIIILIQVAFFPSYLISQSLTKERIDKLKKSVVKISVEGTKSGGTGFFFSTGGDVLTCWHVIEPALIKDSRGNLIDIRKITMQLSDGQIKELGIPTIFFSDPQLNMLA